MQTDWYSTRKVGTYLVLPAGVALERAHLSEEAWNLMDGASAVPFYRDVDGIETAKEFNFVGVDDCLKQSGYSLLRT